MASEDGQVRQLALIDGFVIDCLPGDNHEFDAEITEFPAESGGTFSDNIRNKPLVVTMECFVSNAPLEFASQFRGANSVPTDDAYAMLMAIRKDRRLVDIDTSLDHFDNMGLERLSIPRATGRGDELRFHATFKQVEIVENRREVRVAIPAAQGARKDNVVTDRLAKRMVFISQSFHIWFDDDINGWREDAHFVRPQFFQPGNTNTVIQNAPPSSEALNSTINGKPNFGGFLLKKHRPLELSREEWNNRTVDENRDEVIKQLLIEKRKKNPFHINPADMEVLPPGRYLIRDFLG